MSYQKLLNLVEHKQLDFTIETVSKRMDSGDGHVLPDIGGKPIQDQNTDCYYHFDERKPVLQVSYLVFSVHVILVMLTVLLAQ